MNWLDSTREDTLTFEMVSPFSYDSMGMLDGVILDGSSLTYGYYTDSRVSGTLNVVDSNYIDNTLIRITHHVQADDYAKVLGTFFVTSDDLSYEHGVYSGSLELHSMIQALSDDIHRDCFTIANGTYASTVIKSLVGYEGLQLNLTSCPDHRYSDAKVYDYGENVLTTVFDQCDLMGARLDVDGYGTIQVNKYAEPSAQTPMFDFDFSSPQSVIAGSVSVSSDRFTTINGTGIHFKGKNANGNDAEYFATADVSSASPASFGRRGRRVIKTYNVTDMQPPTQKQAQNLANRYLDENDDEALEYSFTGFYIGDLTEGSVVRFSLDGQTWRKCLVKSMDVSLSPGMPTKYTLKAV